MSGLRIVGVGGTGLAAVDRLIGSRKGNFVSAAVDRDATALGRSLATLKLRLPDVSDRGDVGLTDELDRSVRRMLEEGDAVCIVGGLAGGTASVVLPMIAKLAAELGKPPLVIVAKPRAGEGGEREAVARLSMARIGGAAVLLVALPAELLDADDAGEVLARVLERITTALPDGRTTAGDLARISADLSNEFTALRRASPPQRDWLRTPAIELRPHRLARPSFRDVSVLDRAVVPDRPQRRATFKPRTRGGRATRPPAARPPRTAPVSPPDPPAAPRAAPDPATPSPGGRAARDAAPPAAGTEEATGEAAAAAGRPGRSTALPDVSLDVVHFTVTTPAAVAPGSHFLLSIWAHIDAQRREVLERARDEQTDKDVRVHGKGPVHVARGTLLTVRLRIDGLVVDDPEDAILWEGEIGNASFPVFVPSDASPGQLPGTLTVHADGLRAVKIRFLVNVGSGEATLEPAPTQVEMHRKAFASYASQDRDAMLARVQGMQKTMPHLEIFIDVVTLRSGQDWAVELARQIPGNDVFYLFWSEHARRSEWVEREWRCAYDTKGIDFIDPVPLVSPDRVPPPPELSSRHFNDWHLAFMSRSGVG